MRIIHKIYAYLTFRFWTTCPHCHKKFGGHEKKHMEHVKINGKNYRYVCGKCKKEHA